MSEAEERAVQIRANLHQDMHTTWIGLGHTERLAQRVLDLLVDDAMFQIEHLLVEIEALHIKDRAKGTPLPQPGGPNEEWHRD